MNVRVAANPGSDTYDIFISDLDDSPYKVFAYSIIGDLDESLPEEGEDITYFDANHRWSFFDLADMNEGHFETESIDDMERAIVMRIIVVDSEEKPIALAGAVSLLRH